MTEERCNYPNKSNQMPCKLLKKSCHYHKNMTIQDSLNTPNSNINNEKKRDKGRFSNKIKKERKNNNCIQIIKLLIEEKEEQVSGNEKFIKKIYINFFFNKKKIHLKKIFYL